VSDRLREARYTLRANPLTAAVYRTVWDWYHPGTRFVFCATTGRSGTGALAELFAGLPGCAAEHEAAPIMNGPVMIADNEGRPELADRVYRVRKAFNIRHVAGDRPVYVETNHAFIKSFWRRALDDFGERLRVIHLRRHPFHVARSMTRIGTTPGTEDGDWWYLDYEAPANLVTAIVPELRDGGAFDHPFHRALWYWYEIEARVARMRAEAPWLPVHTLSWSTTLAPGPLREVVEWTGLPADAGVLERASRRRVNEQREEKRVEAPDEGRLRGMYEAFRRRLVDSGHDPARVAPEGEPVW